MHYKQSCYVLVQIFSCYAFFSYSLVVGMIVWKVNPWTQHVLQVHHFMTFHLRTFSQQNEEKISSWIMSNMVQSLISLAECHVHNDLILWSQHAEDPSSFSRKRLVSATWFWLLERHSGLWCTWSDSCVFWGENSGVNVMSLLPLLHNLRINCFIWSGAKHKDTWQYSLEHWSGSMAMERNHFTQHILWQI